MSDDIVTQARGLVLTLPSRTHWEGCHERHYGCMIARLADEVERLRGTNARQERELASLRDACQRLADGLRLARPGGGA
jgi:hypothetical protein